MNPEPIKLYSAEATRNLDNIAINEFKIPSYELMKRAGKATFDHFQNTYPLAGSILVCCGAGNNAGDGYVVAKLAHRAGLRVKVISLVDTDKLTGDAKLAWFDWHSLGHQLAHFSIELLNKSDVVIDALLGTGLQREVEGEWAEVIEAINNSNKPVISVDIPSGLYADTGSIAGHVIKAASTITFIGLKKGLFTHHGVDCVGKLLFDNLSLPSGVYNRQAEQATLLDWEYLKRQLKPRISSAHKHQLGHVFVLGGDKGMPGAIRLAAEAALRSGAGLVTVVSHKEHTPILLAGRPELMLNPSEDGQLPADLLSKASAVVIGPGLTDSDWSQNLLASALACSAPKIVDAGALRLLSKENEPRNDWILTPHAGEAAALLDNGADGDELINASTIQDSRFTSIEMLHLLYGGHIVLKGAGSLIQSPDQLIQLCPYGNPGMASAGMGDVLSGILGSLVGQGYGLALATSLGVCIHSMAGDMAAVKGESGLLASDLFEFIRQLMNTYE
ncbi:MAG: NAD(P)H-hydrate dehydratase [Gammaproteobacteria bacterium]|nr:NAD(P)H-hydrate dehydratase [Gammaproteobacteria bacterium]